MAYERKLLLAKILASIGLILYALLPYVASFGPTRYAPNVLVLYNWVLYGNLMALPIMLWAVWSKQLHGTGRSVRLMGFLGLASTLGFFMASRSIAYIDDDPWHNNLIEGVDNNVLFSGVIFLMLFSGIILSIHRKST